MSIYNGFDINTASTPKPWGAREEQAVKDIIDTLVGDAIGGVKATGGHVHNKLYYDASNTAVTIDGSGNVTFIGTVGVNDLDVTTNIDTATLRTTSTVGIGIATPDGTCHIHTATAGSVSPDAAADDLVLENSGDCGLSILSPDANFSLIAFGSPTDNFGAIARWKHSTALMEIGSANASGQLSLLSGNAAEAARIDASGNVGINFSVPTTKLNIRTDTNDDGILLETVTGGTDLVRIFKDAATTNGRIDLYSGGSSTVQLRSNGVSSFTGGNLGIGILNPATSLNIQTDTNDDGILLETITGGTDIVRIFKDAGTTDARIDMMTGGTTAIQLRANGITHFSGGNVGVGTSSPGTIDATQLNGTGKTMLSIDDSDNWSALTLSTSRAVADEDLLTMIQFGAKNETSGHGIKATVRVIADGATAGQEGGRYEIWTKPDGSSTLASRFFVDQGGNVGVGTVPTYTFDVNKTVAGTYVSRILNNSSTGDGLLITAGPSSPVGTYTLLNLMDAGSNVRFIVKDNGYTGIGTDTPTTRLDINNDTFRLRIAKVPASAGAAGTTGTIAWGTDGGTSYLYVCIATNTWERVALATW